MKKKQIAALGLWMLLIMMLGQGVFASAPKMSAKITEKNVLSLMGAYNTDAAYIFKKSIKSGEPLLFWWFGAESIVDSVDTAMHEEIHGYSYRKAGYDKEDIYIGNKKYIRVKYTSVFRSRKMAATIPKKLRTFRWKDYVGKPSKYMASDQNGVYGLLNEFTAYCWGMNAQLSLFSYYKKHNATPEQWTGFINSCANDRLAYAEFKYYILHYLLYAKKHKPSVYRGIVNNTKFKKAFRTIEKKFASQNKKFEKRVKEIKKLLEKRGYDVECGTYFAVPVMGNSYPVADFFQKDYNNLIKEMKKSKYKSILKKLGFK